MDVLKTVLNAPHGTPNVLHEDKTLKDLQRQLSGSGTTHTEQDAGVLWAETSVGQHWTINVSN